MLRITFGLLLSLLCACATVTRQAPDPSLSSARDTSAAVVIIGLGDTTLNGACEIAFGKAGSGIADRIIEMGWASGDGARTYRSFKLPAGPWDFYQLRCGDHAFHAPVGSPGYSRAGTKFNPLARFFLSPREVVYLGDLVLVPNSAFARFTSEMRVNAARKELARHNPELSKAMVSRQLFREEN